MEEYKIKANERFFEQVIACLKENGVWGWPDQLEFFTKKNGKLVGINRALTKVKGIVSPEFFTQNFEENEI